MKSNDKWLKLAKCLCNSPLTRFLEFGLGLLFVISGVGHINNPFAFMHSILNYNILSGHMATAVALVLPPLEFLTGISLLSGIGRHGGLAISTTMFALFSIAQASALIRGLKIDCGCFGRFSHVVSIESVAIVTLLFVLAIVLLFVAGTNNVSAETNT